MPPRVRKIPRKVAGTAPAAPRREDFETWTAFEDALWKHALAHDGPEPIAVFLAARPQTVEDEIDKELSYLRRWWLSSAPLLVRKHGPAPTQQYIDRAIERAREQFAERNVAPTDRSRQ